MWITEISDRKYKNKREQVLSIVYNFIDGIQLLALCIGRHSSFDTGVYRPIIRYADLHILFTQHNYDKFTNVLWAYFIIFLVAVLAFLYRLVRLRKGKPARSVQIYSSMITRAIMFGLFIPFVKLFASVFACGQDDWLGEASPPLVECLSLTWTVYAAIAGGVLGVFVPLTVGFFFLFRHNHIGCPDFESRPHGRFHAPYVVGRLAMIAATAAAPGESTLVQIVYLACTGLPLVALLKTLPSYRRFMNYIRGGFLAAAFHLSVASLIMSGVGVQGDPKRVLGSSVLIALSGLAFVAGVAAVWLAYWKVEKLANQEAPEFETPYIAELCSRSLLEREAQPSDEAKQKAEALLRAGIEQFPSSAYIQLQYAHFLKAFAKNANAAGQEVRNCWRKEPAIDFRYEAHSTKIFWERQSQLHGGDKAGAAAADLFSSADNKRMYDKARQGHTRTLKLIRAFWATLSKKNLHVAGALDDVPRRLADIDLQAKDAEVAYTSLLKRASTPPPLQRTPPTNDKAKSQLYYMKADEVEENESKTASLSASQSQSQSQSQSAGAGAQSASESQSASSGASSSAAAKKRAMTKELKLRSNETRAVTKLFWGVILGLLFLGAVSCSMFIVVKIMFVQYDQALTRLRTISFQRRRVVAVNNMVRWMNLGSLRNNTALYSHWASEVGIRSKDFSQDHHGLYFGYTDRVLPASSEGAVREFWGKPVLKVVKHFPGPPLYEISEKQSIWDAGNEIMIACKRISLMHIDQFKDMQKLKEAKFVFQNALFGLMGTIEKAKWIILAVCLVAQFLLIGEALFVFRPSFKAVRLTMRGVSDILVGMPRALVKQTAKFYSKAHKRDKDNDGESNSDDSKSHSGSSSDEGKSKGSGSSDRSDASDDEEGRRAARRKRRVSRKKSTARTDEGDEETVKGDDETAKGETSAEEEEEEDAKKKRGKHRKSKDKEEKHHHHRKGRKGSKAGKEAEKGGRGRGRSESEDAAEMEAELEKARARALRRGPAAKKGKPRALEGAEAAPAVVMKMQATLLEEEAEGDGETRETTPSFQRLAPGDGEEADAAAGAGTDRSAASRIVMHSLNVGHDPDDVKIESGVIVSPKEAPRRSNLKELGLAELDDLFDKIREGKDDGKPLRKGDPDAKPGKKARRFSLFEIANSLGLQMQLRPPRRRSVEAGAAPAGAGQGILRKPSMDEKQMVEAVKGAEAEGKAKGDKAEQEADEKKKKKEEEKKKKKAAKAAAAGEREGHGPDVLDLLTRKYMLSFILIGGIFIANFLICFFILDAGKNFAFEINLAGRRRSIAREVAFYTRELYINDGIFLERDDIYFRLVKKVALFKEIHQGLKSGDPSLNELDKVMYDAPQCLRLAESKCTKDRVEDLELVDNGLDALVMGVLDLVIAIMQETTPDLLLTGKEDPSIVVKKNYFNINSKNLDLMMEIDDGDLDDGLNRAAAAFVTEAINSMSIIELIEALILAFNIVFLGFLYIYLFAPMLSRLREESGRTGQILRMLPKDVVIKCPHLHMYFVGIRGDMDDE
eukprot:tig00020965_g16855.t1